jgi:hypothetical protein
MRSSAIAPALALLAAANMAGRAVAGPAGHVVTLCTARGLVRVDLGTRLPGPADRRHDDTACHASCLGSRKGGEADAEEGDG